MRTNVFSKFILIALLSAAGLNLDAQCVQGNCVDGEGKYLWPTNDSYEGKWKKGKQEGLGKLLLASGDYYVGSWSEGEREGPGLIYKKTTKEFDLNYIIFGQTVISVIELDNGDLQFGYFKPGPDGKMALYDGYTFLSTGLFKIENGVKEQLNFDFKSDACLIGDCRSGFGGEYKIDGENRYLRVGQYLDGKWHSAGGHYNFKDGFFFMGIYVPGIPVPCIKSGGQFNYESGVANFVDEGQLIKSISFPVQSSNAVASDQNVPYSNPASDTRAQVVNNPIVANEEKQPTRSQEVQSSSSFNPTESSSVVRASEQTGSSQVVKSYTNEKVATESVSSTVRTDENANAQNQPKKKRKGAFWRTLGTVVAVAAVAYGTYEVGKSIAAVSPKPGETSLSENRNRSNEEGRRRYTLSGGRSEPCGLGYEKFICASYETEYIKTTDGLLGKQDQLRLTLDFTNQNQNKVQVSVAYSYSGGGILGVGNNVRTERFVLFPGSRKRFDHEIILSASTELKVKLNSFEISSLSETQNMSEPTANEIAVQQKLEADKEKADSEKKKGWVLFVTDTDVEIKIDGQRVTFMRAGETYKAAVNQGQIYVEVIPLNNAIPAKKEVVEAPGNGAQIVKQYTFTK